MSTFGDTTQTQDQTQTPAGPVGRPPLRRAYNGRMLAGVCAGIADYLAVDVTIVRVAFAVFAFLGGAGIEQARDDDRVEIRHETFERRGAVHHRHSGYHDIVLDGDALAHLAAQESLVTVERRHDLARGALLHGEEWIPGRDRSAVSAPSAP